MKTIIKYIFLLSLTLTNIAQASPDIEISSPSVNAIKSSMQTRHYELIEYYNNGAIGLSNDGLIVVRDASLVPLPKRQKVNALVSSENQDRNALYKELAQLQNHPEWEMDIRNTFSQKWTQKAQPGWYIKQEGQWIKK